MNKTISEPTINALKAWKIDLNDKRTLLEIIVEKIKNKELVKNKGQWVYRY